MIKRFLGSMRLYTRLFLSLKPRQVWLTQDLAKGCYKSMVLAWYLSGRRRQRSSLLSFAPLVYAGSTGPFLLLKDDCVQHLCPLQTCAQPHQRVCTEQSLVTVLPDELVSKHDACLRKQVSCVNGSSRVFTSSRSTVPPEDICVFCCV